LARTDQRRRLHDAREFAQDFDRELARAFLLFQSDPIGDGTADDMARRFAQRYEHWQSTSAYPRLIKELYAFSQTEEGPAELRRFDPAARRFETAEWPAAMHDWREQIAPKTEQRDEPGRGALFVRRMAPVIWESVPALVVPSPTFFFAAAVKPGAGGPAALEHLARSAPSGGIITPSIAYSILVIDTDYVSRELLPALARKHFAPPQGDRPAAEAASQPLDFEVAIVSRNGAHASPVYQSSASFAPAYDAPADAVADFFQVRPQDFTGLVAEVRRFTTLVTQHAIGGAPAGGRFVTTDGAPPMSVLIQQTPGPVVAHPSGSLEKAVNAARTRNLVVSFSILAILGASMGLLVLATRRSQRLAQQQMEFVATVSHELRTPLAVIRSAAENLADGVVDDEERIKRYGALMRAEGRRLTEMVEQILEIAGMQSGQRNFALRPVAVEPLVKDIVSSCASLIEDAGVSVELEIADGLPAVLGDEPALRRVFQNLVDNAIKYGASGGWVKIAARAANGSVVVSVADRGIGIEPAEQSKIFEPFYRAAAVVAAQVQGAGLGLSLVQRIVAAHGGSVAVKSAPRSGSEFIVQLPAAAAPRYS
jgi:signal transduction histidine kinase